MNYSGYSKLIEKIAAVIGSRKLVLRYKNTALENELLEKAGLKASFYVTGEANKVNNIDSFPESVLEGKQDEYLLLISPTLGWNINSENRYAQMGYVYMENVFWCRPKPQIYKYTDKPLIVDDIYGNHISLSSPISVKVTGRNNNIVIGKNVCFPKTMVLCADDNINIVIEDNCTISPSLFKFAAYSSIVIHENVKIHGMSVFVNAYSNVEIGKDTTIQTGNLRTGRNQSVVIGEDCMFSWDIVICPHDGHLIWDLHSQKPINNTLGDNRASVILGDHVWVGGETVFMPNSSVGSGSVCGYRTMVKGRFPNNCIIAGQPARIIKKDIAWTRPNVSFDNEEDFLNINEDYRKFTEDGQEQQQTSS